MPTLVPLGAIGRRSPRPHHCAPDDASRRAFLKASAVLTGVLAAGTPLALLAPSRAWALPLDVLDQKQADDVMALAKTLYPHAGLPDAVYALAVKAVDAEAAKPHGKSTLAAGIQALDTASKGQWLKLDAAARTRVVKAIESDPFVQAVRAQCVTSLYDNDMAYAHFGYEGAAYDKGGYLHRGFNDLTWLPDPPPDASPAPGE